MSESTQIIGIASEVTKVELDEMKFIGLPVIVSFKDGDFSQIGRTKHQFMERKHEIEGIIEPEILWAPWYANDIMFTYFYAVQVGDLNHIPAGMLGFTQPKTEYVTVHYEGALPWSPDPYGLLHEFRQREGLEQNDRLMVLEKYRFDLEEDPQGQINIDVFGPIKG